LRFGFFEDDEGGAAVAAGGLEKEENRAGEVVAEGGFEGGSGEGAVTEGREVEVNWAETGERAGTRGEGIEVEEVVEVEGEKEESAEGVGTFVLSESTDLPLPLKAPKG
jgi:hypothetical protein